MWCPLYAITWLLVERGECCAPQFQRTGTNIYWIFGYHEIIFNQRSVTFSNNFECENYNFPRKLRYTNHIYCVLETNVIRKNFHSLFKSQTQPWNTLQYVSTLTIFLLYVAIMFELALMPPVSFPYFVSTGVADDITKSIDY